MTDDDTADDGWAIGGPPVRGRKCGSCTLCCTLLPVKSIGKTGGVKCTAQRSTGCGIYARRPFDCRAFSCRWLIDETTAHLRRPDKVGYVIDPMPDTVLAEGRPLDVVQVWVAHPDAHKDPGLRDWLERTGQTYGIPALIRDTPTEGWMLVPPALTGGDWLELRSTESKSEEEMADVRMGGMKRFFGRGGA